MDVPDVEYIVPPPGFEDDLTASPESQKSQTVFKKHRVLPHPGNGNGSGAGSGTPDSRRSSSGGQRYVHYENTPMPMHNCLRTSLAHTWQATIHSGINGAG